MGRSAGSVQSVFRWVSVALVAVALLACESPDDDDDIQEIEDLSGTVTGTILDSDSDPIPGVTVHYTGNTSSDGVAEVSAVTNAQGQFALAGVVVSGTQNSISSPLTLFLEPPAGYLSGTVAVSPSAQPIGGVGSSNDVFLDEFNVDTGPVKLPATATTISGVLRDTGTGSAVAGSMVSAEFIITAFEQADTTGIALTYGAAATISTDSDASGSFTLSGVADDSCVRVLVAGYSIDGLSGSAPPCLIAEVDDDPNALELKTNTASITLANVFLTPYATEDGVSPFVTSVVGVVNPDSDPAPLDSSVTGVPPNELKIKFSEAMAATITAADVTVLLGTAPDITSAPLDSVMLSGGDTLSIATAAPLPSGTAVTVQIVRGTLKDTAGNPVVLNDAIAYDEFSGSSATLFELDLLTFEPSDATADAALPSQVVTTSVPEDPAFVTTSALIDTAVVGGESIGQAATPSGGSVLYSNLIGTDSDDVEQLNSADAEDGLQDLLNALEGDGSRELFTDIARVHVLASAEAADYLVTVERNGTPLDALFFPVATLDGAPENDGPVTAGTSRYVIDPNGATEFDLIVTGRTAATLLQDGDTFKIVSRNASAILGGTATLALHDIAPPTVGVQLLTEVLAATAGTSGQGGGGGVIVDGTDPEPGFVIYPITPQAADVDDSEAGFDADDFQGDNELLGLSDEMLQASAFVDGLGTTETAADATGSMAFLSSIGPRLGLVVTEPISLVEGTAPGTTDIDASLSSFGVLNSAVTEDGDPTILFTYRVDSLFQLEADANASDEATIDLGGVIRDLNGLLADDAARALVRVRDYFPPLMTLAFYDGSNFVFRFHEAINKAGSIILETCAETIDVAATEVELSPDGTTLTAPATLVADPESCFDPTLAYEEDAYALSEIGDLTDLTSVALVQTHGFVSYDSISDTTDNLGDGVGNSWASWASNGLGITTPYFAAADVTPP